MFFGLLSFSLLTMIAGLALIAVALIALYFKLVFRFIRRLIEFLFAVFFVIFDKIFVVNKGKTAPYEEKKPDFIVRKETLKSKIVSERQAREFLGAVNFVEGLKLKYPLADEEIFEGLAERVLEITRPRQLDDIESMIKLSHEKNKQIKH